MHHPRPPGPGLTTTERRRLDELERWFDVHDPALAATLKHGRRRPHTVTRLAVAAAFLVAEPLLLLAALIAVAVALAFALALFAVVDLAGAALSGIRALAPRVGVHRYQHQHGRGKPHPR